MIRLPPEGPGVRREGDAVGERRPKSVDECRAEVKAFALLMEEKLRENDHKSGWRGCDVDALFVRLVEEARELRGCPLREAQGYAPRSMTPDVPAERLRIGREAADVANFAMMIADVCGALPAFPVDGAAGPEGGTDSG